MVVWWYYSSCCCRWCVGANCVCCSLFGIRSFVFFLLPGSPACVVRPLLRRSAHAVVFVVIAVVQLFVESADGGPPVWTTRLTTNARTGPLGPSIRTAHTSNACGWICLRARFSLVVVVGGGGHAGKFAAGGVGGADVVLIRHSHGWTWTLVLYSCAAVQSLQKGGPFVVETTHSPLFSQASQHPTASTMRPC